MQPDVVGFVGLLLGGRLFLHVWPLPVLVQRSLCGHYPHGASLACGNDLTSSLSSSSVSLWLQANAWFAIMLLLAMRVSMLMLTMSTSPDRALMPGSCLGRSGRQHLCRSLLHHSFLTCCQPWLHADIPNREHNWFWRRSYPVPHRCHAAAIPTGSRPVSPFHGSGTSHLLDLTASASNAVQQCSSLAAHWGR